MALMLSGHARLGIAEPAQAATRQARPHASGSEGTLLGGLSFSSSREPIAMTADTLEFDYRTRILTYKGSVVVTQGDMKLESTTLRVALDDQSDNRVKEVAAIGDVRLTKGTRWATAGRATFDQTQRTVVLSDNAVLHDGDNTVKGERVTVYLDEERSVVEGGSGRVQAVLIPPADGGKGTPP